VARGAQLSLAPCSYPRVPGLMAPLYNYRAPTTTAVQELQGYGTISPDALG
jgi:hypothetical protein